MRIVPYNGNRAYKYYLDGYKVNGKRKRLFFKDEAAADRKLADLAKQQRKEGQDVLDVPLDLNRSVLQGRSSSQKKLTKTS